MFQHKNQGTSSLAYRPDIDGLRAVASLAVVGFHAFPRWMPGGFAGVDIFFVISGFLISSIIFRNMEQGRFSFVDFYARRIRRIFPALALVLAVTLLFGWFALFPYELKALGKHVFGGSAFISNLLYWAESGYFDSDARTKPLLHLWSLGIEEQFYILFPLMICFLWKKKIPIAVSVSVLFAFSFLCNLAMYATWPTADFYSPLTRFWEILAGSLLAVYSFSTSGLLPRAIQSADKKLLRHSAVRRMCEESPARTAISLVGLLAVGASILFIEEGAGFPGYKALLPVAGAVLLIMAGPRAFANRLFLSNTLAVGIGLISYPLYLWHWPLLSYAYTLLGTPGRMIRIVAVIASLTAAWLTFVFIERPVRAGKAGKALMVAVLSVLMGFTGLVGLFIFSMDGFPERASMAAYQEKLAGMAFLPVRNEAGFLYAPFVPQNSYCRYENVNSDTTVAIFGDSHAHAAFYGIAEINKQLGRNTFLISNSPSQMPLAGILMSEDSERYAATMSMVQSITTKDDIRTVFIIINGGTDYFERGNYKGIYPEKAPEDLFLLSLQKIIDAFTGAGKKVSIVIDSPFLPEHIRLYIGHPLLASMAPPLKREDVLQAQKPYRQILNSTHGATVIETIDWFCPKEDCIILNEEGLPLYYDVDHLSNIGSMFLAKHLEPYLSEEMEQ